MTDRLCGYTDREETILGFLYDELESARRGDFEAHLLVCTVCRGEVADLRAVRAQLGKWEPPSIGESSSSSGRAAGGWRAIPAWAQVAAALLVLGVSAGVANLRVHYDNSGLTIRTGWSDASAGDAAAGAAANGQGAAPWRDDLAALEQQLRTDFRAQQTSAHAAAGNAVPVRVASTTDGETLRRVRALLEESEKRQQRELALHIAELLRDVNVQRQADLVKIERNLGAMRNDLGVEVLQQRQSLNYFMRVNQRQ